jgi:hypothetical protein
MRALTIHHHERRVHKSTAPRRVSSPSGIFSTLITSAPMSASVNLQVGAGVGQIDHLQAASGPWRLLRDRCELPSNGLGGSCFRGSRGLRHGRSSVGTTRPRAGCARVLHHGFSIVAERGGACSAALRLAMRLHLLKTGPHGSVARARPRSRRLEQRAHRRSARQLVVRSRARARTSTSPPSPWSTSETQNRRRASAARWRRAALVLDVHRHVLGVRRHRTRRRQTAWRAPRPPVLDDDRASPLESRRATAVFLSQVDADDVQW